jgi:hypothetical protein
MPVTPRGKRLARRTQKEEDACHRCAEPDRQGRIGLCRKLRSGLEEDRAFRLRDVSANGREYRAELLSAIVKHAPTDFESPTLVGIFSAGETQGSRSSSGHPGHPKGRLILPQVQVIRDILDNGGLALTVTFDCFPKLHDSLKELPALVITDSQVFPQVNSILPRDVPLTSFSISYGQEQG